MLQTHHIWLEAKQSHHYHCSEGRYFSVFSFVFCLANLPQWSLWLNCSTINIQTWEVVHQISKSAFNTTIFPVVSIFSSNISNASSLFAFPPLVTESIKNLTFISHSPINRSWSRPPCLSITTKRKSCCKLPWHSFSNSILNGFQ